MFTNELKMEGGPPNFYHAVLGHVRQCQKKNFEIKSYTAITVLVNTAIMKKWEPEAILQLLQAIVS